jgi:hypothetical protein
MTNYQYQRIFFRLVIAYTAIFMIEIKLLGALMPVVLWHGMGYQNSI